MDAVKLLNVELAGIVPSQAMQLPRLSAGYASRTRQGSRLAKKHEKGLMRRSDLCKLLDVALHKASNKISLTVTDAPQAETRLRSLLADAIGAGRRNGLPLSEVQLCLDLFPDMLDNFCWAKVTDSADPDVLRLIYEPDLSTGAAA